MLARKYQMVEYDYVHRFAYCCQALRESSVDLTRHCVPRKMIVRENDARAPQSRDVLNQASQGNAGAGFMSDMLRKVQAARMVINMGNPQMLFRAVGLCEAARKESPGCLKSIQPNGCFGTLKEHVEVLVAGWSRRERNRIRNGAIIHRFRRLALVRAASLTRLDPCANISI